MAGKNIVKRVLDAASKSIVGKKNPGPKDKLNINLPVQESQHGCHSKLVDGCPDKSIEVNEITFRGEAGLGIQDIRSQEVGASGGKQFVIGAKLVRTEKKSVLTMKGSSDPCASDTRF